MAPNNRFSPEFAVTAPIRVKVVKLTATTIPGDVNVAKYATLLAEQTLSKEFSPELAVMAPMRVMEDKSCLTTIAGETPWPKKPYCLEPGAKQLQ